MGACTFTKHTPIIYTRVCLHSCHGNMLHPQLELGDNKLTGGLEALSKCPSLRHLSLVGNRLASVDVLTPLVRTSLHERYAGKDTLDKRDTFCPKHPVCVHVYTCTLQPLKSGHLTNKDISFIPRVSRLGRFHCTCMYTILLLLQLIQLQHKIE